MDWERKFSSIVQETESNLAKVKQRLGSAHASSVNALTMNGHSNLLPNRSDQLSLRNNSFAHSFPLPGNYSSPFNSIHAATPNKFLPGTSALPYLGSSPGPGDYRVPDGTMPIAQSQAVLSLLANKLDAQTQSIDKLTKCVHDLEDEKQNHQRQVQNVYDELSTLKRRFSDKYIGSESDQNVEGWKREMASEIQLLKSQLQSQRGDDMGTLSSTSILKELRETKRHVTDECDLIRHDVTTLQNRLVKFEADVSNVIRDKSDLERMHNKIDMNDNAYVFHSSKSMHELMTSHGNTIRSMSRAVGERSEDKAEIDELRSSLLSINQKLDRVQDQVLRHVDKCKHKSSRRHKTRHCETPTAIDESLATTDVDEMTDSTDILELYSSDLSLSPKCNKSFLKFIGTLSEDDVDRDLTTDDLISSSYLDMKDLK